MIRMTSSQCTYATTSRRPEDEDGKPHEALSPRGRSKSSPVTEGGNTPAASSDETLCFRRFAQLFDHSIRSAPILFALLQYRRRAVV